MFGVDLHSPTEAAIIPAETVHECDVTDYKQELILSLSSARELAVTNIKEGQQCNKERYDQRVHTKKLKVRDWVLVRFPQEESVKQQKLSRPWHGPYRIIRKTESDVTTVPVHFPESGSILVQISQVSPCLLKWPVGFYWYGGNRLSRGKVPSWVERLLEVGKEAPIGDIQDNQDEDDTNKVEDVNNETKEGTEEEIEEDTEEGTEEETEDNHISGVAPEEGASPAGRYNLRPRNGFPYGWWTN